MSQSKYYAAVLPHAWANAYGYGVIYSISGFRETLAEAESDGVSLARGDDFLIARIAGRELVQLTSSEGNALDWEDSDYRRVADHCGLIWNCNA